MRRIDTKVRIALLCVLLLLLIPAVTVFQTVHRNQLDAALLTALRNNDTNAALEALKQGADPNVRGTLIGTSYSPSFLDILMALIGKPSPRVRYPGQRMVTALMIASHCGNEVLVREILRRGGDVNAKRSGRETALVFAVIVHNFKVTQILLEHGADPDVTDLNGKSVLLIACENGATDIMKALVLKGANIHVNVPGGRSLLEIVAEKDTTDGVSFLLAHGVTVSGPVALPVLVAACFNDRVKNTKIVEEVLAAVEASNAKPTYGLGFLLSIAASRGNLPLVKLLLAHGIGTSRTDLSQALIQAPQGASYAVCRLLVDHGADVNATEMNGMTPLITAATGSAYSQVLPPETITRRKTEISQICLLLLTHGAKVNIQDRAGNTPLIYAINAGWNEKLIDFLLEYHADVNAPARDGRTPRQIATSYGKYVPNSDRSSFYSTVLSKLIKAGAK